MSVHRSTQKEEQWNAITHGIGAILSLVAIVLLIREANANEQPWALISVLVYGITMFMMYMSSTLLHSLPEGKWKDFFHMLDHSSIFLFIAGSYTPVSMLLIKGTLGKTILITVWGCALFGILFKIIFLKKFMILTTLIYLLLGWFVVIAWQPIATTLATQGLRLLVLGGLCYSVGTIFFLWRSLPYNHAVWHLFVILGSGLHFFTILHYILGTE
nr:hemolysin III family protein [Salirhabdus sp. Marseille-P4669]